MLAGDFLSPSLASNEFKGEQMITSLNALRLDLAVLGNHEFDIDLETLEKRIRESSFKYVAANVFHKDGRLIEGVKSHVTFDMGGARVAVLGLLTEETAEKSTHGREITVADPIATGKRLAARLRRQGADIIIALTHLSMCDDKRLAREADVDLIVGGHEHELLQSMAGRAHISKMGSDARDLGRIDLHLARAGRGRFRVKDIDWSRLSVDKNIPEDAQVKQVVDHWEGRLKQKYPDLDEKVGQTKAELNVLASDLRRSETNFGSFVADIYRQAYENADAALLNSGGIRSDRTYGSDNQTTDLTNRDLRGIFPYSNNLVLAEMTGDQIKKALEHGVSEVSTAAGQFPQVSGLSFSYDGSKPAGQRISDLRIAGSEYDPQKKYRVVVNSFMFDRNGDGYDFTGATRLSEKGKEPVDRDVIIDYIKKHSPIAPRKENRIVPAGEQAPALDPCESAPQPARVRNRPRRKAA
jgi:5'-nucleotidase